ncbi:hypothetical protein GCK72_021000 [Caenorhabditis remanei]|uniref:G-protein coupled receptors family 1 profile domain-containing protein n=1 Tax=Caenorhabditis remanei TaxID=31234 RepID=A0A6A5GGY2_CAERE|nr:hypothetical protein GCK72_021000 [Caenorhabditis remanei]KAF1754438.1 hypothetical protein GCK72_021000 [Caenorhabditis remanei]
MSLDNTSITFDVDYLIKYPDLILSIFGFVTNLIHLFVLSLKVSTIPNFIFLTFICGTDLLQLVTSGINKIWTVLTYIEHKNCIGYMNHVDMGFKFLSVWSQYFSLTAAPWITVVMAVTVIRNEKINWQGAKRYAIFTLVASTLYSSIWILNAIILFQYLPYAPCSADSYLQHYMAENDNWVTNSTILMAVIEFLLEFSWNFGCLVLLLMFVVKKCKKKYSENGTVLLLLSFLVPNILSVVGYRLFTKGDDNATQEVLIIPNGIASLVRVSGTCCRPFLILWKCKDYQLIVDSIFDITGGVGSRIIEVESTPISK